MKSTVFLSEFSEACVSCVKIFCFRVELSTRHTGFLTRLTQGVPVPIPMKTRTLSVGTGFWRVRGQGALKYPRGTPDNPYPGSQWPGPSQLDRTSSPDEARRRRLG